MAGGGGEEEIVSDIMNCIFSYIVVLWEDPVSEMGQHFAGRVKGRITSYLEREAGVARAESYNIQGDTAGTR
jgi:hypothetical protein